MLFHRPVEPDPDPSGLEIAQKLTLVRNAG
jgi:hypothetical protein